MKVLVTLSFFGVLGFSQMAAASKPCSELFGPRYLVQPERLFQEGCGGGGGTAVFRPKKKAKPAQRTPTVKRPAATDPTARRSVAVQPVLVTSPGEYRIEMPARDEASMIPALTAEQKAEQKTEQKVEPKVEPKTEPKTEQKTEQKAEAQPAEKK